LRLSAVFPSATTSAVVGLARPPEEFPKDDHAYQEQGKKTVPRHSEGLKANCPQRQ
jgi:hypothetical protein